MLKANAVLHEIVCSKITRWGLDSSVIIFASLANGLLPGYFNRGSGDFPVQCWWSPAIKTVLNNTSELFSSKPSHSPIHCIVFGVLCFSEWNCKAHTHLKHSIFFSISDDSLLLCYCKAREGVWLFSDLICCWKFFFMSVLLLQLLFASTTWTKMVISQMASSSRCWRWWWGTISKTLSYSKL